MTHRIVERNGTTYTMKTESIGQHRRERDDDAYEDNPSLAEPRRAEPLKDQGSLGLDDGSEDFTLAPDPPADLAARDARAAQLRSREAEVGGALAQMIGVESDDEGDGAPPDAAVASERTTDEAKVGIEQWRGLLSEIRNRLVSLSRAGGLAGMTRGARRADAVLIRDALAEIKDRIDAYIRDFDSVNSQEAER